MHALRYKRILLGSVTALGVAAGPPAAEPVKPASAVVPVPVDLTARDPLAVLLTEAQTAHGRLRDYACTFTKQERVNGLLTAEQVAEMKVRVHPFSVSLRYASPAEVAGQRILFRPSPDGKMRFRPAGALSTAPYQFVFPDDPKVMATSRRPVTKLGIGSILDTLQAAVGRERALNNPVEVLTADYEFAGRPVTRYEVFTRRPHTHRVFYRAVVFVDKETKLPVRFETYDQPRPGGGMSGELVEMYSYTDIKPNVGLGDNAFSD